MSLSEATTEHGMKHNLSLPPVTMDLFYGGSITRSVCTHVCKGREKNQDTRNFSLCHDVFQLLSPRDRYKVKVGPKYTKELWPQKIMTVYH